MTRESFTQYCCSSLSIQCYERTAGSRTYDKAVCSVGRVGAVGDAISVWTSGFGPAPTGLMDGRA